MFKVNRLGREPFPPEKPADPFIGDIGDVVALGSVAGGTEPVGLLFAAPIAEIAGPGAFYLVAGAICAAMGTLGLLSSDLVRIEEA